MNRGFVGVIAFGTILAVASCSRDGREIVQREAPVTFNVDESLLAETVIDQSLGISYGYPVGWSRIHDSLLVLIRQSLGEQGAALVDIRAAYSDPDEKSVMVVSRLYEFDLGRPSVTLNAYREEFTESAEALDSKTDIFDTPDFTIYQFIGTTRSSVTLKLVYSSEGLTLPVQFDVIVPRERYINLVKHIESVFGSVTIH